MGVDVEPGCGSSRRCYSVAVVEDGRLVEKYEQVPLHRLIRLIWELRPDVLAVDNVYELAADARELGRVASMLPPELSIVQPTRLPDGSLVDVRHLARLAGLDPGRGKPSPSRTAYLVALLASMGYGSRLRFVEEKTRIIVARNRRLKHGGMSSPRYQRRVRAAILRAVKDIKRALDRSRLDYDLMFRKSGGGLDSAVFIVYAPRSRLNGIIKSHEDTDVRIEVQPVYSHKLSFEHPAAPQERGRKPFIIVGVDPGISTGIAALDLRGRPVLALSRRGMDREEVVELIRSHGIPVMIATDVNPAPDFVKKLAGMLHVPLYTPPASLSVEEKREIFEKLAQRYPGLRRIADSHVRDAFAAAVKAYRVHEAKLRQIDSYLSRISLDIDTEEIKALVIKGKSIAEAVEEAINRALAGEERAALIVRRRHGPRSGGAQHRAEEKPGSNGAQAAARPREELLLARLNALAARVRELEEELERLRMENRLLAIEYRESLGLERDREIAALTERVNTLQRELEKLREENTRLREENQLLREALLRAAHGLLVPAPVLDELDNEDLERLAAHSDTYGKTIAVLRRVNPVALASRLPEAAPMLRALLVPGERLEEARQAVEKQHRVPVLPAEPYLAAEASGLALLDPRVIVDAYTRLREVEEEIRREQEARRRVLTRDRLRAMLEEYRARRAKKLLAGQKEQEARQPPGGG